MPPWIQAVLSPLGPGLPLAFAKPDELTQSAEPAPQPEGQPAVGMGAAGGAGTVRWP